MAEKQGSAARGSSRPRPTIALPPRPSLDAVFGAGASPGPLTMVSRFFSDCYTDPEYRSFSQLLAGAMQSPAAAGAKPPENLVAAPPSFFLVPPSPGFFSPQSPFGMSHQQALAQVTAQAALSQSHLHFEPAYAPSSATEPSTYQPSLNYDATTSQQMQLSASYSKSPEMQSSDVPSSDKKSQPVYLGVDKPANDGYNWRKYGQKHVKGSEHPRSYYKCTHLNCPVKKQVERSPTGQISEIIYRGQHNHEQPPPNKRSKGGSDQNGNTVPQAKHEPVSHGQTGNVNRSNETTPAHPTLGRDQESVQLSRSSNHEEVDSETRIEDNNDSDSEPNPKRRNTDTGTGALEVASSQKTVAEAKIIVQTRSEVDLLDDGYRWRKYGQKVVKGNTHPRSYYRCTYAGCNVRKHVERASADPKAVITTYEGKHDHDLPATRSNSLNATNNNAQQLKPPGVTGENRALVKETDYGNAQRPAVLQLKEEQVIV